jgi:hypothetical protein
MRRLCLILAVCLLTPVGATALADGTQSAAAGDGSLSISGASASIIYVYGNGLIFGHIDQGSLTVVDYRGDPNGAQVSGTVQKQPVGNSTQYAGSDIRFLFPNGRYVLRFNGTGIDISAVGKGAVSGIGLGTQNDGTIGTNGGKGVPLGSGPTTLVFGASKGPNAAPTGNFNGNGNANANGRGFGH